MQLVHRLPTSMRVLTVGLSLLLFATMLPAGPAQAKAKKNKGIAVSKAFFGMHDSDPTSWPAARIGSLRLWDSSVTWKDIETSPGVFNWTRLDAQVKAGRAHGAEITLVLGQTPAFHTASTQHASCAVSTSVSCSRLGTGTSSVPVESAWKAYVRQVALRYAGRIQYLQVWNEANVIGYWAGSAKQMARLTYLTRTTLSAAHSRMKIIAPAMVARSGLTFMNSYYAQKASGHTMNSLVDKVALQLYPSATGLPEDGIVKLAAARKILAKRKVTKPIWNTEVNYGLSAGGLGTRPRAIGTERQAAYVIRTFLLNASNRVERVFWYSWDLAPIANTVLSKNGKATLAGKAVTLTQTWLAGSRLKGCSRTAKGKLKGTYTCTLTYKKGVKRIYWNPTRRVKVTTARSATFSTNLYGKTTRLKGGSKKLVDYHPVLVRSKR